MRLLRTQLRELPTIMRLSETGSPLAPHAVHETLIQQVEDSITILNRVIVQWDNFFTALEQHESHPESGDEKWAREDRIRIEVIDDTYSFITFLFLLLGFYRGIDAATRKVTADLGFDLSLLCNLPEEHGTIADLRTLRHKMVAHTAHLDPRNDTPADRFAYLEWYVGYWGFEDDLRNRRLNTFGVGVGDESSSHAIPPPFAGMVEDSHSFIRECEDCISLNIHQVADSLVRNPTNKCIILPP